MTQIMLAIIIPLLLLTIATAQSIVQLNVGGATDQPNLITGKTFSASSSVTVKGTTDPSLYSSHRWGKSFRYDIPVPSAGVYDITIHLAETYKPTCKADARVFDVLAFDSSKPSAAVEKVSLDVFSLVGCETAYVLPLRGVVIGSSLKLAVQFTARANNAMLSGLDVSTGTGSSTTAPMVPSAPPAQGSFQIDSGGSSDRSDLVVGSSMTYKGLHSISGTSNNALYSRHRWGKDFSYVLPVSPGTFKITVQFAEGYFRACKTGFRVFDVSAFDADKTESTGTKVSDVDVFKTAGCFTAYSLNISPVSIGSSGKLKVRFLAKSNNAMVSGLVVEPTTPSAGSPPKASSPPVITSPPSSSSNEVLSVDAGGSTDIPGSVSGTSRTFKGDMNIAGTTNDLLFASHRFGKDFTYNVSVAPGSVYSVELFFSEVYEPGCKTGFRMFDITVFDADKGEAAGTKFSNVDVFKSVGCRVAYTMKVDSVAIGSQGDIGIRLKASTNNAMISGFRVTTVDPTGVQIPTPPVVPPSKAPSGVPVSSSPPSSSSSPGQETTDMVLINVGSSDKNIAGTSKVSLSSSVTGTPNVPASSYKTAREGKDFQYVFNLKPGAYDIILGFVEAKGGDNCLEPGKRVFNVFVNDMLQLEGFDIYSAANGCFKGVEEKFTQSVSTVLTKPLVIRFESVVGKAQLSYLSIKPAKASCVPESVSGGLSADHAAHAVPGTYPPQLNANSPKSYVDTDGDGFVTVFINGKGSHTHFSDSKNNILGRLTKYTWTLVETGEVVSNKESFSYKFPLGTTRLKLSVIDNSCSTDEAETTVTVTGAVKPGQYCYYYSGLKEIPVGDTLLDDPRPMFAEASNTLNLNFPTFPFSDTLFAARCFFFLEVDIEGENTIAIDTGNSGLARIYKGTDLIVDSEEMSSTKTELPVGLTRFEVTYLRTTLSKTPQLKVLVDGKVPPLSKVSYDRKTVVPILAMVSPSEGNVQGGTQVKVTGYGLFQPLSISIGGKSVKILPFGVTEKQFFFNTPQANGEGVVEIVATTGSDLTSNPVNFAYGNTCDSVKFTYEELKKPNGKSVDYLHLSTCVTIGHDQRLYIGRLGGTVHAVGYDRTTMQATSHCYSKPITDPEFKIKGKLSQREILGIALDPRDKSIRPYVSTSTLFVQKRIDISNAGGWRNGAIERLKPGKDASDKGVCLVYDKRIVSGLPVSNHDHSVNALLFTNDGDLLIAIGGSTNMGLPGSRLGNFWESPLSGAVVLAKLSKPGFNGAVKYSAERPELAKQVSGDVEVYSGGLRNPFGMTMDALGQIIATDQSCNCLFGNVAASCSDFNAAQASTWNAASGDWPTSNSVPGASCATNSVSRPDKVLLLEKGKNFGHANLQRGGGECSWIDPFTGKNVLGQAAPSSYKAPLALVKSPATGVGVYAATHFCEKMRGDVITTAFRARATFRIGLDNGKKTSGPDQLIGTGGIAFAENAHGELMLPRQNAKQLFMLRPAVSKKAGLYVSGMTPIRHGKSGGLPLTIGGFNFGAAPKVSVQGKTCVVTMSSDTEIKCTMPSHSAGTKSVTVTTAMGESKKVSNAVLYMNV